jgi:pantoate--beta-alanine ligase
VREADGLAMSSRNAYLAPDDRARATVLSRALRLVGDAAVDGVRDAAQLRELVVDTIDDVPGIRLDYAVVVDATTLEPLVAVDRDSLVAVAAFVGTTRLIDNVTLTVDGATVAVDTGVVTPPSASESRTALAEVPVP